MCNKSLVSITDYSKEDILRILNLTKKFDEQPNRRLLEGKVCATLFLSRRHGHALVLRLQ